MDHLPILNILDLVLQQALASKPRNYRIVNWEEFEKELKTRLDSTEPPTQI